MKIVMNGREFQSRDELPAELREQYDQFTSLLADKDGNGIPDGLEGKLPAMKLAAGMSPLTMVAQKIIVNGREYSSVEELPADVRRQIGDQVATALTRAQPLDGLEIPTPLITFGAAGGRQWNLPSIGLALVGGIIIGLAIALGILFAIK